ncbi:uncharacterized protein LOC62_03G004313 [Vanrija pseudolonga]|uniref:Uncharacterized protein n=1 Tax=Vanrija pseudolonga TaxID=143232 RepID=A0AAF0YBW5_9TREE|nr:hypothetical protein LOC62_03G004313 [Vanrija pseudolonga]
MPVNYASTLFDDLPYTNLAIGAAVGATAYAVKVYTGGRKCIWERDWAGKLIMIAAPPEPTTWALIHHLLHLPSPPQILYLPPLPSPLPDDLLMMLQIIRLSASENPLAQLHCEALPPTPTGVREFVRKWSTVQYGTAGEGGRRVDAIVLGGAWECLPPPEPYRPGLDEKDKVEEDWTPHQFHFHLITALLPSLLRAPPERNIRIISLVSPGWSAAIPGLEAQMENKKVVGQTGPLAEAAKRGLTSFLLQTQLRLILDTLASATYSKKEIVPDPDKPLVKARDTEIQSNILALNVIMPWARSEVVKPVWGEGTFLRWLLWTLLYPLVVLLTPSPSKSIQPILYALSAPVKFPGDDLPPTADEGRKDAAVPVQPPDGKDAVDEKVKAKAKTKDLDEITDPRRNGVRQGDVVRDCGIIDIPPVLHDRLLAAATYDKLEAEVEKGVKAAELREKAFGKTSAGASDGSTPKPADERKVQFQ